MELSFNIFLIQVCHIYCKPIRILAKGWEAEKIIRNLKSTTECFDVKSEDISKNEIKFICETDSIVEFVKELCSK